MESAKAMLAGIFASLVAFLAAPGGAALAAYLALNILNACMGKPLPADDLSFLARADRLIDRLVFLCRRDALNRVSAPIFGVSVYEEVKDFFDDEQRKEQRSRESAVPPPPPDRSSSMVFVIGLLAASALVAEEGCRPRAPDGCTPFATRCSPLGIPQVCSQRGYWSQSMADECPSGSVCGLAPVMSSDGDAGRLMHRCARPSSLVDSGVSEDAGVSE